MLRESSPDKKLSMYIPVQIVSRNMLFILFTIIAGIIFYLPLKDLITLSFHKEVYSHIVLMPLLCGYFFFSERNKIFHTNSYSFIPGIIFITFGMMLFLTGRAYGDQLNQNDYLSLMTFAAIIFWLGGVVLCYGMQSFRNARFPFLFLVFMIPIPTLILDKIVFLLQKGSAEAAYGIFIITGIPFVREGTTFHLPEFSVEVAEQCSGIRSSIALLITSILAGHLFLRSVWRKSVLTLSIIPITIVKNGVRIVTLTLLGAYVDKTFITNSLLHQNGGILFFILALLLLAPLLMFLRKTESRAQGVKVGATLRSTRVNSDSIRDSSGREK